MLRYLLLIGLIVLNGCATSTLQRSDLARLEPNMPQNVVLEKLQKKEPRYTVEANHSGQTYFAHSYDLQIGARQNTYMHCSGSGATFMCFPVTSSVPVTEPYLLIFKGKQSQEAPLLTWESEASLSTVDDTEVAAIAPQIKQKVAQMRAAEQAKYAEESHNNDH